MASILQVTWHSKEDNETRRRTTKTSSLLEAVQRSKDEEQMVKTITRDKRLEDTGLPLDSGRTLWTKSTGWFCQGATKNCYLLRRSWSEVAVEGDVLEAPAVNLTRLVPMEWSIGKKVASLKSWSRTTG